MTTIRTAVTIYTDGSCLRNGAENAPGGWAAIMQFGNNRKELCGGAIGTTNNQMELTAVIEALKKLNRPCDATIVTDSQYVIRIFSSMKDWYSAGWKQKSGKAPANMDLIRQLVDVGIAGKHKFHWQYVKGHDGHPENERCDKIAKQQAHVAWEMFCQENKQEDSYASALEALAN